MPTSILKTKLHRPSIDEPHLHRSRLIDLLDQSRYRPHCPLALVSAPAGYGKSILVSCWLESCETPSAWLSMDESDNDLAIFVTYFTAAIQSIFPNVGPETRSLTINNPLPSVSVLANSLLNELKQIGQPFILALDDYHRIRHRGVHELIAKLLKNPFAHMRLVLIARRDPSLPLTALRSKGQLVEIRTRDLRFTLEETSALLQHLTGSPVDRSVAVILDKKTEGWVTGLRLAALAVGQTSDLAGSLTHMATDTRLVVDDAVSETLCRYPPAVQEAMLGSSVLNRFCASLCAAVCFSAAEPHAGDQNDHNIFEILINSDFLVVPLDDQRQWFRLHHLFQTVLKRRLRQRFGGEEIARLHQRASAWFAEHGYIEEALGHALESGDLAAAARLVKVHRHAIMNREQWYQLNRWLQIFPQNYIYANPDLLMAKAWVVQRAARYSELFAVLDQLASDLRASRDKPSTADPVLWKEFQALTSFRYFATAQGALAAEAALQALQDLPAGCHCPRGFSFLILSLAMQMQGKGQQARRLALDALKQEDPGSISTFKGHLLVGLGYISWIAADLNRLAPTAAQVLKHGQRSGLPETVVYGHFFSAILHYQRNELVMAERSLLAITGPTESRDRAIPSIVTHCQASFALSLTYQAMGRDQEAGKVVEALIDSMLEAGNTDLLEICRVFRADLALRQGHFAEADLWARTHTPIPLLPVYRFYTPQLVLPKVFLARRTAQSLSAAESLLSEMHAFFSSIHCLRVLIDVCILQSLVYAAQGNASMATAKLVDALALARPGGFVRPFLDSGPELLDLLGRIVPQNPSLRYAGRILEAFGSCRSDLTRDRTNGNHPSRSSSHGDALMSPLTNREIEVLRMLGKGASNQAIGQSLYISPQTVKRHLSTIYSKLEVKNRIQATIRARSIGIL